jgi:Rrf2 family protein
MKFSAQEEYGLRCLLQIAAKGQDGWITIPEISQAEGLTATHVAKLLMILRKAGVIKSTRGHSGGYQIADAPNTIRLGDVLAALGGRLYDSEFCDKHRGQRTICARSTECQIKWIWQNVQDAVDEVLNNVTLADLMSSKEIEVAKIEWFSEPPVGARSR